MQRVVLFTGTIPQNTEGQMPFTPQREMIQE